MIAPVRLDIEESQINKRKSMFINEDCESSDGLIEELYLNNPLNNDCPIYKFTIHD